jgi:hypothetical protein
MLQKDNELVKLRGKMRRRSSEDRFIFMRFVRAGNSLTIILVGASKQTGRHRFTNDIIIVNSTIVLQILISDGNVKRLIDA